MLLSENHLLILDELNRIVMAASDPLEGNLFYRHHEPNPGRNNIINFFHDKRLNYVNVCRRSRRMIEIGFNAGHSALLALACGLEYHGVDICRHDYTRPAAEFLKKAFGDRFHFYEGDSLMVLPAMHLLYPSLRFDLLHIDGYHTLDHCRADTKNAMAMALDNAWVLIDDTDMPHIRTFFDDEVKAKRIAAIVPDQWIATPHHDIGQVSR